MLRTLLILVGAVVLARFSWAFFLFGAFLLFTAGRVWRGDEGIPTPRANIVIRTAARLIPHHRPVSRHQNDRSAGR